jgi:hypothetical protein
MCDLTISFGRVQGPAGLLPAGILYGLRPRMGQTRALMGYDFPYAVQVQAHGPDQPAGRLEPRPASRLRGRPRPRYVLWLRHKMPTELRHACVTSPDRRGWGWPARPRTLTVSGPGAEDKDGRTRVNYHIGPTTPPSYCRYRRTLRVGLATGHFRKRQFGAVHGENIVHPPSRRSDGVHL